MLDLGLKDKVAIITGGSEGLGRAAAQRLAAEGARVAICSRRADVLAKTAEGIRKAGGQVFAKSVDVTKADQIGVFVDDVVRDWGGVDILVNNAGTSAAASFDLVDDVGWQHDFDLKVFSAIRLCRLCIPHMKKRGGGRIINVTNLGAKVPQARGLPTSVSRAAGINLTKSLANEYAPDKILVNTICIGLVKSAQWERRAKGDVEAFYKETGTRVPIGRMGEAEEFGDLVAFLVSERAAFITGTAINFDGGMAAVV